MLLKNINNKITTNNNQDNIEKNNFEKNSDNSKDNKIIYILSSLALITIIALIIKAKSKWYVHTLVHFMELVLNEMFFDTNFQKRYMQIAPKQGMLNHFVYLLVNKYWYCLIFIGKP